MNKKILEKKILEICIKIARRGEGAMIIFGDNITNYNFLVKQEFKPFNVMDNPKTMEVLCLQDGAVWIDKKGIIKGYGIYMKRIDKILNKGTRHGAGIYASKQGNIVFLVSQEDKKVRILKNGKIVAEIYALDKNVKKDIDRLPDIDNIPELFSKIFESLGFGTLAGTISVFTFTSAGMTGIALTPSIIIFSTGYYIINKLRK